jgi:hypothetical protein
MKDDSVRVIQGRYHQDYLCPICGWKAPWLDIRTKGWGKAQAARRRVREHVEHCHKDEKEILKH